LILGHADAPAMKIGNGLYLIAAG